MIELENVFSGYGSASVINNVSLQLPEGKLVSLVGPNGSGKSTLLKTIAGIISPSAGRIMIDGVCIESMNRKDIARKLAYLPQSRDVPDMTVEQMVLHGRFPHLSYPRRYSDDDRRIVADSLRTTGILHLAASPVAKLSGGMRQNAYIAMALAQDTRHILLDEPTTGLDISNQLSFMKFLHGLACRGRSIVAVMHDLPLALTFSDVVIVVADGVIQATGTPPELYESNTMKKIFGVETGFCSEEKYYYYKHKNI